MRSEPSKFRVNGFYIFLLKTLAGMGNGLFCDKGDSTNVNLSKGCVDRFINESTGEQYSSEEIWMNKLRCIDDYHSEKTGINVENFEKTAKILEKELKIIKELPCKERHDVIECIQENPDCLIRCKEEMDRFIECVDSLRIHTIKRRIEEARKSHLREKFNTK